MVIYKTTNLVNGKQYIGRDKYNNPNYFGSGRLLKKAVRKYGKENFKKEILEVCSSFENMVEREEYWLNYYDAGNNKMFYNMHNNGAGGMGLSGEKHYMYGKHHTEERKRKWSESRKGEKNGMYGKGYLLKGEKNYWYGKHLPEEVRRKISESRQGEKNHNYGKRYSDELKNKISLSLIGRKFSEEHKKNISEASKGKVISDETRKKMSESHRKRDNSGEKNPMFGLTGEKSSSFKGYVLCVDGQYKGQRKTSKEWSLIMGVSISVISMHLSGKRSKNGIKGNFFKWEHQL